LGLGLGLLPRLFGAETDLLGLGQFRLEFLLLGLELLFDLLAPLLVLLGKLVASTLGLFLGLLPRRVGLGTQALGLGEALGGLLALLLDLDLLVLEFLLGIAASAFGLLDLLTEAGKFRLHLLAFGRQSLVGFGLEPAPHLLFFGAYALGLRLGRTACLLGGQARALRLLQGGVGLGDLLLTAQLFFLELPFVGPLCLIVLRLELLHPLGDVLFRRLPGRLCLGFLAQGPGQVFARVGELLVELQDFLIGGALFLLDLAADLTGLFAIGHVEGGHSGVVLACGVVLAWLGGVGNGLDQAFGVFVGRS